MVGPYQTVIIFLEKFTTDQACHVNIKPLIVKPSEYPWRILLMSPADQTQLAILFNRMTGLLD